MFPTHQIHEWLTSTLKEGARVGVDPFLHTVEAAEKLSSQLQAAGMTLVPLIAGNPVDAVWGADRPAPPKACVKIGVADVHGVANRHRPLVHADG